MSPVFQGRNAQALICILPQIRRALVTKRIQPNETNLPGSTPHPLAKTKGRLPNQRQTPIQNEYATRPDASLIKRLSGHCALRPVSSERCQTQKKPGYPRKSPGSLSHDVARNSRGTVYVPDFSRPIKQNKQKRHPDLTPDAAWKSRKVSEPHPQSRKATPSPSTS